MNQTKTTQTSTPEQNKAEAVEKVTQAEFLWWEKTVEYAFVRRVLPKTAEACPMSGHPEKWLGDLLEKNQGNFRLIEFKREKNSINDELKKYVRNKKDRELCGHYSDWINENGDGLLDMPGAKGHWLVFGKADKFELDLLALPYGSADEEKPIPLESSERLQYVRPKDFANYLLALSKLRGNEDPSGLGGLIVAAVKETSQLEAFNITDFLDVAESYPDYNNLFPPPVKNAKQQSSATNRFRG